MIAKLDRLSRSLADFANLLVEVRSGEHWSLQASAFAQLLPVRPKPAIALIEAVPIEEALELPVVEPRPLRLASPPRVIETRGRGNAQ